MKQASEIFFYATESQYLSHMLRLNLQSGEQNIAT